MFTLPGFMAFLGGMLISVGLIWWLNKNGYLHQWARQAMQSLPQGSIPQRIAAQLAANTVPAAAAIVSQPPRSKRPVRAAQVVEQIVEKSPALDVAANQQVPTFARLKKLSVGNTIQFTSLTGEDIATEVVAVITHQELYQQGGEWRATGDTFKLVQLRNSHWLWIRGANLAHFQTVQQLTDGQLAEYKALANEFGQNKAEAERTGKPITPVTFTIQGQILEITDIGLSDLTVDGVCDVGNGRARFIQAESQDDNSRICWIEERKAGADVRMFGNRLNLTDVKDIQ